MVIERTNKIFLLLAFFLIFFIATYFVRAVPSGPDAITSISNETKGVSGGLIQNQSEGGGYINTIIINGTTQNTRWKAYVGNVTGKLTLDDASGSTIYDWVLSASMAGEIYATRNSSTPSWTNVNCTWAKAGDGDVTTNRTLEENENYAMNHTNPDDNITATFDVRDNVGFYVGDVQIAANDCYTTNPYVNNATQSIQFEEILIHDGTNLIYASVVEDSVVGFDSNYYDFQMIVPENGASTWTLSTAYYFYVELS